MDRQGRVLHKRDAGSRSDLRFAAAHQRLAGPRVGLGLKRAPRCQRIAHHRPSLILPVAGRAGSGETARARPFADQQPCVHGPAIRLARRLHRSCTRRRLQCRTDGLPAERGTALPAARPALPVPRQPSLRHGAIGRQGGQRGCKQHLVAGILPEACELHSGRIGVCRPTGREAACPRPDEVRPTHGESYRG